MQQYLMTSHQLDRVTGVAIDDPLQARQPPQAIKVTSIQLALDGPTGNSGIATVGSLKGLMLTVSFRDGASHHTDGCAVLVHPGVAITAKHVVEEWLPHLRSGAASAVCQA